MTSANGKRPGTQSEQWPCDLEAEEALLGAALLSRPAAEVVALAVTPDAFLRHNHRIIAEAITELVRAGDTPDPILVHGELDRHGHGYISLADLLQLKAPTLKNAPAYGRRIVARYRDRLKIAASTELTAALREGLDPKPFLDRLDELIADGAPPIRFEDVAAALDADAADDPAFLVRSDGQRLLYSGAVNALQAEPAAGKTTLAGVAAVQVLEAGGDVAYLDFEDILPRLARRLLALDAARDQLVQRFHYLRPGPLTDADAAALVEAVARLNVDLVVIDGVAEALAAQNLDEESGSDIARWWSMLPRPLAATGAAVLIIDHVTKSKENRGRWARGSGHKLAAIDGAAYALDATVPFSRSRPGRLTLTVAKDRPGAVGGTGDVAAIVHVEPAAGGKRLVVRLDPSFFVEEDGGPKTEPVITDELRTAVLESIARLTVDGGSVSRNDILNDVRATGLHFRDKALGVCLARLWQDGEVHRANGPNRSHLYSQPTHQPTLEEATA